MHFISRKLGEDRYDDKRQNDNKIEGQDQCDQTDQVILDAITYHTTGRPNMTLMDKIIFVADYIEPNRKMLPEMEEIRKEAFTDLDACVIHILKNTLDYLNRTTAEMDYMTQKTYDFYVVHNMEL